MDFVNIFITFSGRINRAKYWIAALVYAAISLVFGVAAYFADSTAVQTINTVVTVVLTISSFGVAIKRLHDRNKSGWYVLLFLVAPGILLALGLLLGTVSGESGFGATALWLIAFAILIWAFIELGCLRGSIGQNQYGPDPLAPEVLTPPVRTHA